MALNTTPGDPAADSYPTLVEAKAYWDSIGRDYSGMADDEIEQALRRGTAWLDGTYGARFIGKASTFDQALEWPRQDAVYRGEALPSDEIPRKVKNAASEAAWREATEPNSLSPDYVPGEGVKQEQVGPLSVTYKDGAGGVADVLPVVTAVDGLLRGLVASKASLNFATAARG